MDLKRPHAKGARHISLCDFANFGLCVKYKIAKVMLAFELPKNEKTG